MSITKEAIDALQQSLVIDSIACNIDDFKDSNREAIMALPDGFKVVSLDQYQEHPAWFKFKLTTNSIDDFIDYAIQHQKSKTESLCLVDYSEMKAKAIFDMGNPENPQHKHHTANLDLCRTVAYSAFLNKFANAKENQKAASDLLLDWSDHLTCIDRKGDAMATAVAAQAMRNITVEQSKQVNSVVGDYANSMDSMERIEADKEQRLPAEIIFKTQPYLGFEVRSFRIGISLITGDKPVFSFRAIGLESEQESIGQEFKTLLKSKITDMTVLVGW